MRSVLILVLLAPLAGCSTLAPRSCASGQQAAVQDLLYFGTDKPDGTISADDWSRYLAQTFTQSFPEGFTVWQAAGQWRAASGEIIHEASYLLSLVHPKTAEAESSIRDFISTYKSAFQQEAVLRVTSDVCISF